MRIRFYNSSIGISIFISLDATWILNRKFNSHPNCGTSWVSHVVDKVPKNCAQRIQIDQNRCVHRSMIIIVVFFFKRISPHISFLASVAVARKRTIRWSSSTHSDAVHVFVSLAARFHDEKGETSSMYEAIRIHLQVIIGVRWCASANSIIARATGRSGKC